MIKNAYDEHNRLKKQGWLLIPLVLMVMGLIVVFGNRYLESASLPEVVEQSEAGMVLELPSTAADNPSSWQSDWVPASEAARQQVLQSLSEFYTDFRQLRPQLSIWAEPGSEPLNKLAARLGKDLAQFNVGGPMNDKLPPASADISDSGVLLYCKESDSVLARRLMAALAPYLAGRITLRYDPQSSGQSMRLYLFGKPHFNEQGQATFDTAVST